MQEIDIDLKNELLATTNTSFRRLLELGGDAVALYMFYLYTSNWQDNKSPKATNTYVEKGLGWGRMKVVNAKNKLLQAGWVEDRILRDEKGKIVGHYVTVKYRVSHSTTNPLVEKSTSGENATNTPIINKILLKDNKIHHKDSECVSVIKDIDNSELQVKKYSNPSLEEVKVFIKENNYAVNADTWFNYYTSNGWKVGRNSMKDWKACVRTWNAKEKPITEQMKVIKL